ncbi:MAG: hypothetical protein I3J02_07720 [Prevotella sp.]|nr:hypothetical protein [Prevotella sp.]
MTNIVIIIVFWAILFIIAFVFLPLWRRHHDAVMGLYARTQDDNKLSVNYAMKKFNCKVSWEKDHEDLVAHYTYQGGHFGLRVEKNTPYVRLTYPFFFDVELEYIEAVRNVCNHCNLNTETSKVVYTVNEAKGVVDVHIVSELLISDNTVKEVMERAMKNIFRWQRVFVTKYNELKEASQKVYNHDLEKTVASQARELFLIREQEMMHQSDGPEWHEQPADPIRLRYLLATAMGLSDIVPARMVITQDTEVRILEEPDAILDYDIRQALIADGDFVHRSAVALLDYYDPRNPVKQRHLTMDFEQEGKAVDTLYYRVTLSIAPLSVRVSLIPDDLERQNLMTSVLLGYDLTPSERRVEEFRYVWKEALGKQKSGHVEEMSDDERLLMSIRNPNFALAILQGKALFEQQRYYESVFVLESLFKHLQPSLDKMGLTLQGAFMEVCYLIGACYTSLHQYKRAAYYLQLTLPAHRMLYTQTFINCLVNGDDFRAMTFIESYMQDLQSVVGEEHFEGVSGEMHEVAAFMGFLKRRKAYLLVRYERYEEAETLLKQLLDDPSNSSFALRELAYIQKKKAK